MGIAESRGKIIAFIDADAVASPNWLERIRHHHREDGVAAVGGPIMNGNQDKFLGWVPYWAEFTGYTGRSPETQRRVIPTCNLSIKREAFDKHGPFLEEQFGNEDVLLTENLMKAGLSPVFRRDMPVYHINRHKWSEIIPHMRKLGRCTGVARMKYDIAGASTFRSWKKHMALPLVPLYKWALISGRIIRDEPWNLPRLLITSPWLFTALVHWTLGMKDGLNERE
jgi:GT2 family glycosyltransferase